MDRMPSPLRGTTRAFQIEHLFAVQAASSRNAQRTLLSFTLPPFQRASVWDEQRQRAYIEGIFLGLGTGQYVVNGRDWDEAGEELVTSGWLIDGQQRITALSVFVQGRLAVFGGAHFGDLERSEARRFMRTCFPCFELEFTGEEAVLRNLYDRLNFCNQAHEPNMHERKH